LVVSHDVDTLSKALARLLYEPGLREKLADGCHDTAAQLGWDEPVSEMEALYKRLANKVAQVRKAGV
jgi:D-inositol-3-phosphate glycosyltransferase